MSTQATDKVRVSVIMPARNEALYLTPCLESILANDFPKEELEVLVVDGRSEDATREIAESFKGRGLQLRIIDNPERIAPTALNRGLRAARGEIIIRVDGHGEVAHDFIRKSVETLQEVPEAGCVGGDIRPQGKSFMGQVIALAQGSLFGGGGGSWYRSRAAGFVDTVFNPAYRRSIFEKIGFFDETLVRNQDDEFNYRLRQAGYKIYFNPQIRGIYYARDSLVNLAKQHFQYGFWKVKVLRKRAPMMQTRQFVPPIFVATIFFLTVASFIFQPARFALGLIGGAYLGLSIFNSCVMGIGKRWKFVLTLPLAYGAMHFGYGLGFWMGMIYFGVIQRGK